MNNKHGITVRGDSLYCPLPLCIEVYWFCEPDCPHCWIRGLNIVWGSELRPINIDALQKKLVNGLKNNNPQTVLSHCLQQKKTIRIGNKADPFQPVEKKLLLSTQTINVLRKLNWSFVIQTRFLSVMDEVATLAIQQANRKKLVTLLPVISPGLERDWELLEQKKTTSIPERVTSIQNWIKQGVPLGVNGEPFIPGFHTISEFENTLKLLKTIGVTSYNTYNFHFNAHVAKRMLNIPGVDIEKIWNMNQDKHWKVILRKLMDLSIQYEIRLGCPDFVNTGWDWIEPANTCCGINVQNPCTCNTHFFKKLKQKGVTIDKIIENTYDGSGDLQKAKKIVYGETCEFYTLKDII